MNLELFGIIWAKLHPDYVPFYAAILVGMALLLAIHRNVKRTQKYAYETFLLIFRHFDDDIDSME